MREGKLQIYCGSGKGKTTAALGQAIKEASLGRSVFIVQFMKCRKADEEISLSSGWNRRSSYSVSSGERRLLKIWHLKSSRKRS
ncbi:MAG: cob(I)yrinic acid a,c-diamide adenosyltransferase [Lachnospiraceae bacterium]